MAAPPPQDDDAGPEAIAFGIAAVDAALDETDISFPVDTPTLTDAIGDKEIPYDSRGRTVTLANALGEIDRREFDSRRELLNALHPVFEAKRERGGIGGWLRTIFPF